MLVLKDKLLFHNLYDIFVTENVGYTNSLWTIFRTRALKTKQKLWYLPYVKARGVVGRVTKPVGKPTDLVRFKVSGAFALSLSYRFILASRLSCRVTLRIFQRIYLIGFSNNLFKNDNMKTVVWLDYCSYHRVGYKGRLC